MRYVLQRWAIAQSLVSTYMLHCQQLGEKGSFDGSDNSYFFFWRQEAHIFRHVQISLPYLKCNKH